MGDGNMETGTDAAKKSLVEQRDEHLELITMEINDLRTILLPAEGFDEADGEVFITIYILRVIGGWIYWSDDVNMNVFVPERK